MTDTNSIEQALLDKVAAKLPDYAEHHRPDELAAKLIALVREHDAKVVHKTQDPKYSIRNNRLINAERNEDIPLDEPIFLLRARDRYGLDGVFRYFDTIRQAAGEGDVQVNHLDAVRRRLNDFEQFRLSYPERIKTPDSDAYKSPSGKLPNSSFSGQHATQGDVRFVQQNDGPVLSDEDQPG